MGSRWIGRPVKSVMGLLASTSWTETRSKCVCLFSSQTTSNAILKTQYMHIMSVAI